MANMKVEILVTGIPENEFDETMDRIEEYLAGIDLDSTIGIGEPDT